MGKSVDRQSWPCTSINCGKVFGRKGDLTRHQQLHAGIRLHECSVCLKRFSQASGLKTHMNTHSKAKPFTCGIGNCKAAFGDPSSRARHRKETHRRLVPYRCSISGCRSSIKRRSAFAAHLRKHDIDLVNVDIETMAPPLLPMLAPALRRRDTRSIINYDIKPMRLAEEEKFLEQNKEEYYARHHNYHEPWFNNTNQSPVELPPIFAGDFPTGPTFAWNWDSNLDFHTAITNSKLEFKESHSQPHSPHGNNAIGSTSSASTPSPSPKLSPIPKFQSPTTSAVELAGTQMANAQTLFSYPFLPNPNTSMWKGISFCQPPEQKQFGNPFQPIQHQHKDSFTCLPNAPWAFL